LIDPPVLEVMPPVAFAPELPLEISGLELGSPWVWVSITTASRAGKMPF
jgi:hypothetical protein